MVVGLPRNLQSEETDQTRKVRDFVEKLRPELTIAIEFQDESGTSKKAEAEQQESRHRYGVDELAATVEKIRNQVQNSHGTNLRDDIDKIAVKVDNVDRLSRRIGAEIRTDREEFREFRKDTYSKIRHYDTVVAKHHPEDED